MIYSGFFCGSGEGSSLVEVLVVDGGAKIGYTIRMSDGSIYGKIWLYPLVGYTFGS